MAGKANHDYHILEPDIWPLVGSISALTFTSGLVLKLYPDVFGASAGIVMWAGLAGLIATFFMWFKNIVVEAERGDHTPVVQLHMRYGMILFIASEVMFFVGWFWSFFDFALFRPRSATTRRPARPPACSAKRALWPPSSPKACRCSIPSRCRCSTR